MRRNLVLLAIALVCVAGLLVVAIPRLAHGGPGTTSPLALEDSNTGGQEAIAAYPPPPWQGTATPMIPEDWRYASATLDEIAATTLGRLVEGGWASPETRVLRVRDYSVEDAALVGHAPENVLAGSPVDVAVTLEGEIVSWFPGSYGVSTAHPYAVIIVDRQDGSPYSLSLFDSLEQVPTTLR